METAHELERATERGCHGIKPGWVRVNFNYFISEAVFDFILQAVEITASDGWKLLPQYRFDELTGLWRHAAGFAEPPLRLDDVQYENGRMTYPSHRHQELESRLAEYLVDARERLSGPPASEWLPVDPELDAEFEALRWFPLPSEGLDERGAAGPFEGQPIR
jgi:hypothetical protein